MAQARVKAKLKELGLRVLAAAGDVAAEDGARDVAAWVDHHNRVDRPTARREQTLAEALDGCWHRVRAGMRDGVVSLAQAQVITRALDRLPAHIAPEVRAQAEERLVAEAARTWLTGRRRGEGRTRVTGDLPDVTWDRLVTYLEPYLSPRQPGQELENPVLVTIDHASLAGQLSSAGVAAIDDVPLSAAAVRRLACTTGWSRRALRARLETRRLGAGTTPGPARFTRVGPSPPQSRDRR